MRTTWILTALVALATAAAGIAHFAGASSIVTFILAAVALAGLAWIVSFATEQVGERFGPAVTGMLQSTLGNLPEFFIVVFALSAGEIVVARTAILGSIFANALLVLGLVVIAGCIESDDGVMRFHQRKGRSDLAISVVKNSVAQITALLFPLLVLVSLLFATSLTFAIAPVYIVALLLTGLALWQITGDGEATRFEGVALIALFVILAVVTWFE